MNLEIFMILLFIFITVIQILSMNSMNNDNQLTKYKSIIKSFKPSIFQPYSFYERNSHWQTIIGSGALQSKLFGPPNRTFEVYSERIETIDSDFFDVEYTNGFHISDKVVLLVHGLESNIKGNLVTSFTKSFLLKGFECCLVSFRGCNGEENKQPGAYHLGFTDDLNQLITIIHQRYPEKKIYLCGFSLGGNVILKYLGEMNEKAKGLGLCGAAVTCVPFDPAACQRKLDVGFNRAMYSRNFLNTLKVKAELQHLKFPNSFDIEAIRKVDSIGGYDDAFIAKIYGFQDKFDYYRKTGSKWWLSKIRVPVIAINARDDPFIEESSLPTEEDDVGLYAPVRLIYHNYGGHCGFSTQQPYMSGDYPSSVVVLEEEEEGRTTTTAIIKEKASSSNIATTTTTVESKVPSHGWLAEELARVIEHIHNNTLLI